MTSLWRHLSLTSIAYDWRRKLETGSRLTTDAYTPHRRRDSTRQLSRVGVGGVYWAYGIRCSLPN